MSWELIPCAMTVVRSESETQSESEIEADTDVEILAEYAKVHIHTESESESEQPATVAGRGRVVALAEQWTLAPVSVACDGMAEVGVGQQLSAADTAQRSRRG